MNKALDITAHVPITNHCAPTTVQHPASNPSIWTFCSSALSFLEAKNPQRELSLLWNFRSIEVRTFAPGSEKSKNLRSMELSLLRSECFKKFTPWNFHTRGTFAPQSSDCVNNFHSLELLLLWLSRLCQPSTTLLVLMDDWNADQLLAGHNRLLTHVL